MLVRVLILNDPRDEAIVDICVIMQRATQVLPKEEEGMFANTCKALGSKVTTSEVYKLEIAAVSTCLHANGCQHLSVAGHGT